MNWRTRFPVGIEVVCIDNCVHKGATGMVMKHNSDTLCIVWTYHPLKSRIGKENNLFPSRFKPCGESSIVHKIKLMEERFNSRKEKSYVA